MAKTQAEDDMDDDESEGEDKRVDKMAGFCPPPGIVHESLLMEK